MVAAASAWLNKSTSSKYRLFYTQQLQNFLLLFFPTFSSQKYTANVLFSERAFLKDSKVKTQQENGKKSLMERKSMFYVVKATTIVYYKSEEICFFGLSTNNKNKCIEETRIIGFPCLAFLYNCTVGSLDLLL